MAGYGRAAAVALRGLAGVIVQAEAVLTAGLSRFSLIGLPDAGLSESRDRVRAAVINSQITWPQASLTVSLAPASIPKQGSSFDLAIAIAVLRAEGKIRPAELSETVFIAELGLDGSLRPVRGVLPSVPAAVRAGFSAVCVAEANLAEAEQVSGIKSVGVRTLRQAIAYANGEPIPEEPAPQVLHSEPPPPAETDDPNVPDMADVLGQFEARLALEVSATGVGKPGYQNLRNALRRPPRSLVRARRSVVRRRAYPVGVRSTAPSPELRCYFSPSCCCR